MSVLPPRLNRHTLIDADRNDRVDIIILIIIVGSMPLVECIQRAEQRPAARCLERPEPLALDAAVERQLIGDQVGVDLGPFPVRLRDRFNRSTA